MDFIYKVLELLQGIGKDACDKGKQLKKIAHIKSQISACKEVVDKNYREIGRLYYEKYGENAGEFAKQCEAIKNAGNGLTALEEQLELAKQKAE